MSSRRVAAEFVEPGFACRRPFRLWRTWVLALAAVGLSTGAQAQSQVEPMPPSPSPPPPPAAAKDESRPTLGGFMQFDYRRGDPGSQTTASRHEVNAREVRLVAGGKIGSRVRYTAVVQGDGLTANSASVIYAFVDYKALSWLSARAGQFKYEFDMEGREDGHARPFPDAPFAAIAVAGGLNGLSTASAASAAFGDRGISAFGTAPVGGATLGYAVGVFQGPGRSSDNNSKAGLVLNGNAQTKSGLRFNASYLSSDNTPTASPVRRDVYRAWTAGASFDKGKWLLRGEFYDGRRELGESRVDLKGYYSTLGYSAARWLDVLARYQSLERRASTAGAVEDERTVRSLDLGLRCFMDRRDRRSGTYLSLTYSFRDGDATPGNPLGLSVLNDGRGETLKEMRDLAGVLVVRLQVRF